MQDTKLREAFRSLVRHLNLKTADSYCGYYTRDYPNGASCNVARKSDIKDLQEQIDKLKKSKKNASKKIKKKK